MNQYIGLDVSMKETAVSIRQDGNRIWRGKCASDPRLLAAVIRKRAPQAQRVVFETGPLSVWFYYALMAEGLPAICIDARHAKAALDMAANKTDANDADGLSHLAEVGFYREVRVKGFDSMLIRTLITTRNQLLKMRLQMSNQIRGLMKTFGLVVPKGAGGVFERNVRDLLHGEEKLALIVLPMLQAWSDIRSQSAKLSKQEKLVVAHCKDGGCRCALSAVTAEEVGLVLGVEPPAGQHTLVHHDGAYTWSLLTPEDIDLAVGGDGQCILELFDTMLPENGQWQRRVTDREIVQCPPGLDAMLAARLAQKPWSWALEAIWPV